MSLQSRYRKPKPEPATVSGNGTGPLLLTLKQASLYTGLAVKRLRILVSKHEIKRVDLGIQNIYVARAELDRYVGSLKSFAKEPTSVRVFKDGGPIPVVRRKVDEGARERQRMTTMTDDELRQFLSFRLDR